LIPDSSGESLREYLLKRNEQKENDSSHYSLNKVTRAQSK